MGDTLSEVIVYSAVRQVGLRTQLPHIWSGAAPNSEPRSPPAARSPSMPSTSSPSPLSTGRTGKQSSPQLPLGVGNLKSQIGHNIGFQTPKSAPNQYMHEGD